MAHFGEQHAAVGEAHDSHQITGMNGEGGTTLLGTKSRAPSLGCFWLGRSDPLVCIRVETERLRGLSFTGSAFCKQQMTVETASSSKESLTEPSNEEST